MASLTVEIDYESSGDLLWIGNGIPNTDSAQNVTYEPDFDAFFTAEGNCAGLYLFDAARILLPRLTHRSKTVEFRYMELQGVYSKETDTLSIGNGDKVARSEEMATGLAAHYNESGAVVGFTLNQAGELLLPVLEAWHNALPVTTATIAEHRGQDS